MACRCRMAAAAGLMLALLAARMARADDPPVPAPAPADAKARSATLARAMTLHLRTMALRTEGRPAEALPLAREALALREAALGPEHALVATSLCELGTVLQLLGTFPEARAQYERALAIQEKAYGSDGVLVDVTRHNLAVLLVLQGRAREARPLVDRVLANMERRVASPDYPNVAAQLQFLLGTVLSSLGGLLTDQGELDEARRLFERALPLLERTRGADSADVARALTSLSVVLEEQGLYGEAQAAVERALAIQERTLGPSHPDVATSLISLATLLRATGGPSEARRLFERAAAIQETALGRSHPLLGTTLSFLAWVLDDLGRRDEGQPLLERNLAIQEAAMGARHPAVAAALNNLALLLRARGSHAEARPLLERAVEILEAARGADHPDVATMLGNLASEHAALGSYDEARALFERALAIQERMLGPEHPDVASLLELLGVTALRRGDLAAAQTAFRRALKIVETHVRGQLGALTSRQRLGLVRQVRSHLDDWVLLSGLVPLPHAGYAEVLRFRGLVARTEAAERVLARRAGDEAHELMARLESLQHLTAALANVVPAASQAEARAAWQKAYAEAAAERDGLTLTLRQRMAPWRGELERLDLRLDDVQARLGPGTALVDVLRVEVRYVAWIVRGQGEPVRVDLAATEALEPACAAWVAALAEGRDDEAAGAVVRTLVWAPIEARLGPDVERVVLCPDAALAALPFAALPGRAPGRRLLDERRLVHVSSPQDLVPGSGAPAPGGALLVGGVDYDRADATPAEPSDAPVLDARRAIAAADRAPRGGSFKPLAQTGLEVERLGPRFRAGTVRLLGAGATEGELRRHAPGKRYVHVATHGFVRDDLLAGLRRRAGAAEWSGIAVERRLAAGHDPMLLTGLALAGANPRAGGGGDDGILTALEASFLDLDAAELVTLSACETARGTAESGEGVQGLVQAFQLAGARGVIASLWKVDDEATRLLMEGLYERVLRKDGALGPADALRQAALALRDHVEPDGSRRFAAPRYWAAFVAYGR